MSSSITLRNASQSDLQTILQLFKTTVVTTCAAHYTPQQLAVWVAGAENVERWQQAIADQQFLVAEHNNRVVGFASLKAHSYIDFAYVHINFQGRGIARQLYAALEQHARNAGTTVLTADVSITARPFFERMGFAVAKPQTVVRQGIELRNFQMQKRLK